MGVALHQLAAHRDNLFSAVNALLKMPIHLGRRQQRLLKGDQGLTVVNSEPTNVCSVVDLSFAYCESGLAAGASETLDSTIKRDEDGEEYKTCVACMEEDANACLVPCGHTDLCTTCVQKMTRKRCPICRFEFEEIIETTRQKK